MSEPANKELYGKIKREIYDDYSKHMAYRSGLLKEYDARGGKYKGKENHSTGLWFKENGRIREGKRDMKENKYL